MTTSGLFSPTEVLRRLGAGTWVEATPEVMNATGGTITEVGGYKIHTFTSSDTFTVNTAPSGQTIDILVVSGGGG
jgi:hypothetical protein